MASKKDAVAMLKNVPLFEGLSRRELEQILKVAKEIEFDEGHAIVEEGATGVGFHLILEGEAHVLVGGRKRATLRAGDYFGEMSLIDGGPPPPRQVALDRQEDAPGDVPPDAEPGAVPHPLRPGLPLAGPGTRGGQRG
jgi:signal-transduction protein with cAMP-binding, CBS, and nucleotidyltransferase domain